MSHLQRNLLKRDRRPSGGKRMPLNYGPIKWEKYFHDALDVTVNSDKFRVYVKGSEGIKIVLLHGGGYSALTWALFTEEIHARANCQIFAIDIRGHGETVTEIESDLSIETLTQDIVDVINELSIGTDPIMFVGHSMGGALAVHCANAVLNCVALCVIDVVEGTALEALASMQSVIRNRPNGFASIESAIQYSLRSGMTQNIDAARVSMPGQIKNIKTGKVASTEISEDYQENVSEISTSISTCSPFSSVIAEEDTDASSSVAPPPVAPLTAVTNQYEWRINLSKTEMYWHGWFQGLSQLFLNVPVPKLLLLASISGLDTELMVGQMQGKFQMQVLPRCGHAIHEDLPDKVANVIASFLFRHKLSTSKHGNDIIQTFPLY